MLKLGMTLRLTLALSVLSLLGACRSAPEPATVSATTPAVAAPAPEAETEPSAQPAQPTAPVVYDSSTTAISVAAGATFVVALPATIATPMRWRLAPLPDPSVLSAPTEAYHDAPPPDCAGCTGYPGTRTFEIKALAKGVVSLRFAYGSLTDAKAPPEREVAIEVTVQ